jgi:NADPH:quinone reductase
MRAVTADAFGPPEVLHLQEVDTPEPGPSQIRIAVEAAAVNQVDIATRAGLLHDAGLHEPPPVRFGWDVCGTVEAVGSNVRRLAVGQRVIGLSDRLSAPTKTHADQVILDEQATAAIPETLHPAVASALPLAGLTAMQALDRLGLSPGQSVLVTGAAGAVGSLVVQLARMSSLRVFGAGRVSDETLIRNLGADYFVEAGPTTAESVRTLSPSGVDGAIDAAGLNNISLDAVRSSGAHMSLSVLARPAPLRSVRSESIAVVADWKQLIVLASLLDSGTIRVEVAEELDLHDVQKAHELVAAGGLRGRIVLRA